MDETDPEEFTLELEEELPEPPDFPSSLELAGENYKVKAILPWSWRLIGKQNQEFMFSEIKPWLEALVGLKHPLLPQIVQLEAGFLVGDGTPLMPLEVPLKPEVAIPYLRTLADLGIFLAQQGLAMVDLDPNDLGLSVLGLALRRPPWVVQIGAPLPQVYNPGISAPELVAGGLCSGTETTYLLGALAFYMLSGKKLPEGGVPPNIAIPGFSQILAQALNSKEKRPELSELAPSAEVALLQPPPPLEVGAATTIGLNPTRNFNEDAFGFSRIQLWYHPSGYSLLKACVADGMGGMEAGEVASRAAVEAFLADQPPDLSDAMVQAEWTLSAAQSANTAVRAALAGQAGGATLSGIVVYNRRVSLAHVGDSRIYRINPQGIEQLTRDHSLVASLVAMGEITPEQAENHPARSTLLRSLGTPNIPTGYIDSYLANHPEATFDLKPGETLLLVTDGVWDLISPAEMQAAFTGAVQAGCTALIDLALERGAPDNATALAIRG